MNFFTADPHFGHANIIRYCSRPFKDAEEMDRTLIANWNACVSDNDEIFILGDFCYRSRRDPAFYLKALHGQKHLILGNHDMRKLYLGPLRVFFAEVLDYKELKGESGYTFILFHYPVLFWNGTPDVRHVHLYGHIHNSAFCNARTGELYNALNVGMDVSGFRPLSEKEVLKKVAEKSQGKEWRYPARWRTGC